MDQTYPISLRFYNHPVSSVAPEFPCLTGGSKGPGWVPPCPVRGFTSGCWVALSKSEGWFRKPFPEASCVCRFLSG